MRRVIPIEPAPIQRGDNGNGRDRLGRYVTGHPGGPGRPRGSEELRLAFVESFTVQDIQRIARRLKGMALTGDIKAIQTILDRLIGPAVRLFELSLLDREVLNPDERYD